MFRNYKCGLAIVLALISNLSLAEVKVKAKSNVEHHKGTYILPFSYNSELKDSVNQSVETEFQFSLKYQAMKNPLCNVFDYCQAHKLFVAYSQRNYWQTYNRQESTYFRETVHSPEAFIRFVDTGLFEKYGLYQIDVGFIHKSTGQKPPTSRNLNRFFSEFYWGEDGSQFSLATWYTFDQQGAREKYDRNMGVIELGYEYFNTHSRIETKLSTTLRDYNGALRVGYSYNLNNTMALYVQYNGGYGDSMIEFGRKANRLGIGVRLKDW
ncbi:phospholipase A [Saccharobesus litoralis]|uniref:phospholipase A n=1 Tax=Saccharobesus litoralis TaxID=2172099 RepID=UPI00131F0734|nr:phospholipase A [Saccharobesus litoralis]